MIWKVFVIKDTLKCQSTYGFSSQRNRDLFVQNDKLIILNSTNARKAGNIFFFFFKAGISDWSNVDIWLMAVAF